MCNKLVNESDELQRIFGSILKKVMPQALLMEKVQSKKLNKGKNNE